MIKNCHNFSFQIAIMPILLLCLLSISFTTLAKENKEKLESYRPVPIKISLASNCDFNLAYTVCFFGNNNLCRNSLF